MVFLKTFGLQREYPSYLSLESGKFTVSLGFVSGSMEVFVALQPQLDGAFNGDDDYFSAPSVGITIGWCVRKIELFPFQRNVSCEEVLPSQLGLL